LLVALVILLGFFGCGELPTGPAATPEMDIRGVTLAEWTRSGYNNSDAEVAEIKATGANTLALIITAYQTDRSASEIREDAQLTPSESSVLQAVFNWRSTSPFDSLIVAFKPHVDLDTEEWRGRINPADHARWFDSYQTFILKWALLAEQNNVQQFVVGTELAGTLQFEDHWRRLIREVRAVYTGELIYAASWDESSKVPFWDALDLVGVDFYAPVSAREETSRMDLLVGWQQWLERIRLLHKLADRDVLLTEIGYRSIDGAGMHPYDFNRDAVVDLQEQADLYWAAMQAVGDKPWIRGVYWWNWLIDATPASVRKDYTPNGKPAEKELIDAWTP
jgi:hypothetical protein